LCRKIVNIIVVYYVIIRIFMWKDKKLTYL